MFHNTVVASCISEVVKELLFVVKSFNVATVSPTSFVVAFDKPFCN